MRAANFITVWTSFCAVGQGWRCSSVWKLNSVSQNLCKPLKLTIFLINTRAAQSLSDTQMYAHTFRIHRGCTAACVRLYLETCMHHDINRQIWESIMHTHTWHTCRVMAYLLQGPSTTGNKTTTHRTHRTHTVTCGDRATVWPRTRTRMLWYIRSVPQSIDNCLIIGCSTASVTVTVTEYLFQQRILKEHEQPIPPANHVPYGACAEMPGERGSRLWLIVHFPLGYVVKINIPCPWLWPRRDNNLDTLPNADGDFKIIGACWALDIVRRHSPQAFTLQSKRCTQINLHAHCFENAWNAFENSQNHILGRLAPSSSIEVWHQERNQGQDGCLLVVDRAIHKAVSYCELCMCMYVCMMCMCVSMWVCLYVCMHIRMHACMHVCMYMCMYA
jgi:hypothetical protein